jgi:hypothetical protein
MPGTDDDLQARTLLLAAGDTIPASSAEDLLADVRATRTRTRRRTRIAVSLGTATALAGGALAGVVATTATSVQSAYAAITAAAAVTSGQSFRMTLSLGLPDIIMGPRYRPNIETGQFDPARKTGELTVGEGQILWTGGWQYTRSPHPAAPGKPWLAVRAQPTLSIFGLTESFTGPGGALPAGDASSVTPQSLLGLLKAARDVRADGQASGPGWTGTKYEFSYPGGTGSVAVDRQGRVRELDLSITTYYGTDHASHLRATTRVSVGFSDFGVPVHITPPPAGEVRYQN